MPTYDYVCRACEHAFELFQGISEPIQRKCPSCGRLKLERLIGSGSGIVFRGSGFYETDYKRPPRKKDDSEKSPDKRSADKPASEPGPSGGSKPSSDTTPKD